MKTSFMYGIVANSKTRVRCIFCGVFIPKANKCIEEHTNGVKHKENIELMTQNGIIYSHDVLYCNPCEVALGEEESVSKHIESDDHATWMVAMNDLIDGEFIYVEDYLSSKKDELFCDVCNSNFQCTLSEIETHVNGYNHRSNVVERLKPLNGIFPVDNDDEVWCKVCDTYVTNTVQSIFEHIDEDTQHVDWFNEMEELIELQEISIEDYLLYEQENNAVCLKCHTDIICNVLSIEDHVNSESHLNHLVFSL